MVDKRFQFATSFKDAIDNSTYSDDGSPVLFSGNAFTLIDISDWDRIGLVQRNNLLAKAALNNFEPIEIP